MSGKNEAGAGTPAMTSRVQTTGYPIIARKPVRFKPLLRPRVYIAGKVAKLDFRHDLVPGLRDWRRENGSLECRDFIYVGPFFNSCDHGCMHGPGSHGVVGGHGYGCLWPEDRGYDRHDVFTYNQDGLEMADLVFAYISATDCHGSLFELGFAAHAGIPVHLFFAPGIDREDFWYPAMAAERFAGYNVLTRNQLPPVFANVVARWRVR